MFSKQVSSCFWFAVKRFKYIILHNVDMIQKYILGVDPQCDVAKQSGSFYQDCSL